jgi:hypothetical protein
MTNSAGRTFHGAKPDWETPMSQFGECSFSKESGRNYADLVRRVTAAYRTSERTLEKNDSVLWNMIFGKNKAVHDAILNGEYVQALENPASSNLFYGFDNMFLDATNSIKNSPPNQEALTNHYLHQIEILAVATGAKRCWNPRGGALFPTAIKPASDEVEVLLDVISNKIGLQLDFPNPFPDEFGLVTSRGIISERAIPAIYQAWRLKTLSKLYGSRILEVGAGLGRTAYYCHRFGLESYTIIDLPFTNLSQANFLGRALSPDQVSLYGERYAAGSIRILPAAAMHDFDDFDILANVDSLTEMDKNTSLMYVRQFVERARLLWSVNHEANHETVASLDPISKLSIGRFPYWFRPGYLEELFLVGNGVD